jgi:hypothetical protein
MQRAIASSIAGAAFVLAVMSGCSSSSSGNDASATGGAGGSGAGGSAAACKGTAVGAGTASGAIPACSQEMFCKYGESAFLTVRDNIVKRATATGINAQIGDSFTKLTPMQAQTLSDHLGVFLINAYGGDKTAYPYKGDDMKTAHAGLGITMDQYNAFVSMVVVPALMDAGVPMADITGCFAPIVTDPTLSSQIVSK